ncbi:uncharacterized protein LOC116690094 isoform X1 [Etheostoma spectabile]|uniref:uncharacterized protein LOC116690094 isoform X1 n=1 Tax=Etheostoma spectabile TaxID=54343 RepID=UPI0013AF43DD|nr:uncharacterized protein LOC116690094 isoform X1 [Etheostoma spectabile]
MDNQNKDGDSDRESYGLKISELLKALDNRKSPTIDPRNISSTLQTMGTGISNTNGTLRSRAFLPENISQLSKSQFKRRDHLSKSLQASVPVLAPVTGVASSQEGQLQPSLPSSNHVILAHLMLPSDSVCSIVGEHEMHPHVLGVQAWTTQQLCDPLRTLPEQFPQTEPTSEWFFEDLTDLQMKLFSGALKKSGVPRNSQTVRKTHQNPHLYQSVEDKDTENK